jgi:hypothetical protein
MAWAATITERGSQTRAKRKFVLLRQNGVTACAIPLDDWAGLVNAIATATKTPPPVPVEEPADGNG